MFPALGSGPLARRTGTSCSKNLVETSDFSGKDPTVRRRRSKPLIPSTLAGGGSVDEMISVTLWITVGVFGVLE